MKVLITAQGKDLESAVDPRFGRAQYFLLIDSESEAFTVHENSQNLNAPQGAGIQAGSTVIELGAEALITGNVGPKAFSVLQSGKVAMYIGATGTVKEALQAFKAGTLQCTDSANVEGHWV